MDNIIELKPYCIETVSENESDSEKYHEIDQETLLEETTFSVTSSAKCINSYDFFTKHEVKTKEKLKRKRKKKMENRKVSNIMEIINIELASSSTPSIRENVIESLNHFKEQKTLHHKKTALKNILKWHHLDIEQGWRFKADPIKLSPIFPKVLENTSIKDFPVGVYYVEPVMFNDLVAGYADGDGVIRSQKFLDFEVQNMKFKHHHKFSLETLLLVKLIEHYNDYLNIQKLLKEMIRNIKVSRETKNNLKQQLLKITSGNKENVRFDATLLKYTRKLFYYKDVYMDLLKKEKEVIHKVFSLWSDVEMVREKKNKTELNYYLEINKMPLCDDDYEKEWNNIFEMEYSDMLDKIELEYASAYMEYKETKSRCEGDGINKKVRRPKLDIDEVKIKRDSETLVDNILAKEKLEITLKCDSHAMKDLLKPIHVLDAHDYYFKIFVDDIFLCESELYTCKDFMNDMEISESFSVQILPKNKLLVFVLYENDTEVSSIKVSIEEIRKNITQAEYVPFNFMYHDYVIYPNNKYAGSGYGIKEIAAENKVRLKSGNVFSGNLTTACKVNLKIGWNDSGNENTHEIILSSIEIERQLKRFLNGTDKSDINNLIQIINKLYDRNIENDEKLINALKKISKTKVRNVYTFPFYDDNDESKRLKLLSLRNSGGFVNMESKLVPLLANQISTEQFSTLHIRNERVIDGNHFNGDEDMDPIDLQRYLGIKYIQRLNENLQRTVNEFLLQKTHRDVVKDFKDLSLRGILSNQANLTTMSISSYVTRQQLHNECLTKEQEIQVTVIRAFNLPDRAADLWAESDEVHTDRIAGFKVRPLRPYVKLSYHGTSAQSAAGIGCYPSWNQTLKIRTKFSPFSSIHVNVYDECKVNMTAANTDVSCSNSIQYRRCSRWLGTLLVPITTVLTLGAVSGTFKLTTPPLLIGYENTTAKEAKTLIPEVKQIMKKDISFLTLHITTSLSHLGDVQTYTQPIPNVSQNDQLIKHLNSVLTEYVNEFPSRSISFTFVDSSGTNKCVIDYLQPIPIPDLEFFPKNPKSRSGSALSKSSGLSKSSSSQSSLKKGYETKTNSPVKEEEISLPNWRSEDNKLTKAVNTCVRYVSLIPTYEVIEPQVVTLTGLELLKVLYGSPLDHTILLASYFLHLDIKFWIVTGLTLPRGLSTYLLVKFDLVTQKYIRTEDQMFKSRRFFRKNNDFVWHVFDAVAGERYELRDVTCPLKSVFYVFDEENIWVNIQASQDCESVSFDFSKSSEWRQVLDISRQVQRKQLLPLPTLYSKPRDTERLQEALESRIRSKVQKWRPRVKTVWNRYCCTLLRETLPQWEYWSFNSTDPRPEPGQRLKQIMVTYRIFGFPLNMQYVNTKTVLANVKATAVHGNEDPNVEFALAVQVFAYPNNAISVWIYLANITRV